MTNADKIRSMTDEELAKYLCGTIDCGVCPCSYLDDIYYEPCCDGKFGEEYKELLKWLKQEAEEE